MAGAGYSTEVYKSYTTQQAKLGTVMDFPNGERYRFALNGAVALVAGRVVQSVAVVADHTNKAVQAAAAAGAYTVSLTLGATAVAANEYADGYLHINDAGADTTTEGYKYRIKSHPAAGASTTLVVTLYEDCPVKVALTTNGEYTLTRNPFSQVVIQPSPPTGPLAGVAPCAVPANAYFWCQTLGPCAVLVQGAVLAGDMCVASATIDGAVMPSAAFETDGPAVGRVLTANADTELALVKLMLD